MNLRKAAEKVLETYSWNEPMDEPMKDLNQALAQPVDAVNISQERVEETAKREQTPVGYVTNSGKSAYILLGVDLEDDTPLYVAPPKREWNCKHCGETNE